MQQNFKLNGRPRMAIKDFYARSRRVGPASITEPTSRWHPLPTSRRHCDPPESTKPLSPKSQKPHRCDNSRRRLRAAQLFTFICHINLLPTIIQPGRARDEAG